MNLDMVKIGQYIQKCRKQIGLTQAEIGEKLDVTAQAVSNWERGETLPDLAVMADLASILDTSVDAIISGGEMAGQYRRRVTVAQMREAMECIHRLHDLLGPDHFIYSTMANALNERMHSQIEPAFANPRIMEAYICECLIACVRDGNDRVDLHDVRENIRAEKSRDWTLRTLEELGMK